MESPLVILRFTDLQKWERDLLDPIVAPLSARRPVVVIDVPEASQARAIRGARRHGGRYWIWSRDWREAVRRAAPLGGPLFLSVLSLTPKRRPLPTLFLNRMAGGLPSAVRLVTFSPLTQRFFLEMERVPESRVLAMDLAMPVLPPQTIAPISGRTVGTFVPFTNESNLNYLMNVAHYVLRRDRTARFLIAGSGPLLPHVKRMAAELSLADRIDIVESETAREAAACDVFLYTPLRNDHFGPLLHAAAAGRPVVANELPGLDQLLRNGEGGFVVPVNETTPMAEMVLQLLESRELREGQGARLKTALGHRFSGEAIANRCEELFFGAPAGALGTGTQEQTPTVRVA